MSRQHHRRVLPARPTESEAREKRVRTSFVNTTHAIGHRPDAAKSTYDKAASTEARRPWRGYAEPLRRTAAEAALRGGICAERTELLITDAICALLDYILEPMDRSGGDATYLSVAKELPDAVDWIARAHMDEDPAVAERADTEVAEAVVSLRLHRATLRRRQEAFRPLGVSPPGNA